MSEFDSALEDIARVREQLAASSRFQGFAPGVVAVTGLLAFALGAWQALNQKDDLLVWILLAAISALLIGIEAVGRARKAHRSMADKMLSSTLSRFSPVAVAGGAIGILIIVQMPEHSRLLPGIWQFLMGIGIFAVLVGLPKQMAIAGGFYFVTGALSLSLSGAEGPSAAMLMTLPFGAGQLLVAAILYLTSKEPGHGQRQ